MTGNTLTKKLNRFVTLGCVVVVLMLIYCEKSETDPMQQTNRLAQSNSPYLLQHAHNPVDWYPWGDEAFEAAKKQDKPIFLSIGYSTCHWCHVMERESFKDSSIAAVLNENFINIKVDREERPDVDNVYMSVCQMLTGQGGWPLTIVMTPDRKPFFAATYLPPTSRGNRPGVRELASRIGEMWKTQREMLLADANRVTSALRDSIAQSSGSFDPSLIQKAEDALLTQFDHENGGFASPRNNYAPKFPSLHNIAFVLSQHGNDAPEWSERVELTLNRIMRRGIVDQVGGGIHRYSVDREWHVPHFEKMLYDQAWAVKTYAEAAVELKNSEYAEFVENIVQYVVRDLRHEKGAFFAAENADSEGEEGKFYVWSWEELKSVLGDDAERFAELSGAHPQGNFVDEATGQATGLNIISYPSSGAGAEEIAFWDQCKDKLFSARSQRIRPSLDDKVLSAWNGYMIMALARASYLLDKPKYTEYAEQAYTFIQDSVLTSGGKLSTSYRNGSVSATHTVEDYAGMVAASIELYNATGKPSYLEQAKKYIGNAVAEFWDSEHGGFFLGSQDATDLIVRSKDPYDGAMPSANSVLAYYINRFVKMTGDTEYAHIGEATLNAFSNDVASYPGGYTFLLHAASEMYAESSEIVLSGDSGDALLNETLSMLRKQPYANRVVLFNYTEYSKGLSSIAPFVAGYQSEAGGSVYVCKNYACMMPATTIEQVRDNLGYTKD